MMQHKVITVFINVVLNLELIYAMPGLCHKHPPGEQRWRKPDPVETGLHKHTWGTALDTCRALTRDVYYFSPTSATMLLAVVNCGSDRFIVVRLGAII
jgi:hypothetical protein